jgi:hypothetical protein
MGEQPTWDIAVGDKTVEVERLDNVGRFGFNLLRSTRDISKPYKEWVNVSSEAEIRRVAVANYSAVSQLMNSYWDVSTMFALQKNFETGATELKIILPSSRPFGEGVTFCGRELLHLISEIESERIRREVIPRYALELNRPPQFSGSLSRGFDGSHIKWKNISGEGVYSKQLAEWFEKEGNGELVGFNKGMTKDQAKRCPLVLTKLQHPDYVDSKFAFSREEVDEIIEQIFFIGRKEYGLSLMMGQYFPVEQQTSLIWNMLRIDSVEGGAGSRGTYESNGPVSNRKICFPFYREGKPRGTPLDNARKRLQNLLDECCSR